MSAVVHTGSSEARSACGTKVIVFCASARTMAGAASAAAPARADLSKSRRFMVSLPVRRPSAAPLPSRAPVVAAKHGSGDGFFAGAATLGVVHNGRVKDRRPKAPLRDE